MKPIQEWLEPPQNRALYSAIVEDVQAEMRAGKHRIPALLHG